MEPGAPTSSQIEASVAAPTDIIRGDAVMVLAFAVRHAQARGT